MLLAGVLAGLALTLPVPGIVAALLAVLMIQLQILLDCSDGELARWRGVSSPVGIYLDRLAHWVTETALPIGLAIRADGGWDSLGGWTTLGLVAAVLQLFVKGESALVHVARMESGQAAGRGQRRRRGADGERARAAAARRGPAAVLPRVRGDGVHLPRLRRRGRRRDHRRPGRHADPRRRARPDRRDHRARPPAGDPHLRPPEVSRPAYGCVVLTQGGRPAMLDAAVRSLLDQEGVDVDVVVVGNAWEPTGLPDGVRGRGLRENAGIPAGRNAGVGDVAGELLFFLDDDARIRSPHTLAEIARRFAADPALGLVQLRVEPTAEGRYSRDWVPRLRVGDRSRTSDLTAIWEGAVAIPRSTFARVGGWPGEFFFVHEGVDLAWRLLDAGLRIEYAGDLVVEHPPPPLEPTRHGYTNFYGARNRAWLARRYLPWPLVPIFVATFALRTLPRMRTRGELRDALRGYRAGLLGPYGTRRPLRARTLWRMVRAGRPPVI
jgi:GT2 family glycosyltransferase